MITNPDFIAENEQVVSREGELHLRFYLASGDEFALPATGIKEVMQQEPDRITPIPNASPLLLGTINLRGQIIWVADLGQFLGDPALLNTERSEIPVIAIEDQDIILGLAVEKLGDMEWLDNKKLKTTTDVPDYIVPYVQGEWLLNQQDTEQVLKSQYLRLLDQVAILRSARWVA